MLRRFCEFRLPAWRTLADDGSRAAYAVVRGELDRPPSAMVRHPWRPRCSRKELRKLSRSDVRTNSLCLHDRRYAVHCNECLRCARASFLYRFGRTTGVGRRDELQLATKNGQSKVLLLHCYPSDLKVNGEAVNHLGPRLRRSRGRYGATLTTTRSRTMGAHSTPPPVPPDRLKRGRSAIRSSTSTAVS